jgi:hypothetical protein
MGSEQKEEQSGFRASSDREAAAHPSEDKFEDIVDSLLRFVWRFALTVVSFVLIPRSATRRSINPSQVRTYVSPLTFMAICSALLTIIASSLIIRPSPRDSRTSEFFPEKIRSTLETLETQFSLVDAAATSIPGIAVIFLGSWIFGKMFFRQGQGRQRFQNLACYAWGSQCIIIIVALALQLCAQQEWRVINRVVPWVFLYGLLAPSIILLLGAGALHDTIGRRAVGILRYFAIGFFSLILTVTFIPAATLTAVAREELRKLREPRVSTNDSSAPGGRSAWRVRIPYVSAVVEQNSPDVVVLIALVLNNNSDQEFLLSPKGIDVHIRSQPVGAVKWNDSHGVASEISDGGGRVIPVAVLRPKTTEAIQSRIVFHQTNESVFTGKNLLCFVIHLTDISGRPFWVSDCREINLRVEGLQVLQKPEPLPRSQKH